MRKRNPTQPSETTQLPEVERLPKWQEKQSGPGYYIGGLVPLIYHGKRPKRLGYLLLLLGSLTVIPALFVVWGLFTGAELPSTWLGMIAASPSGVAQIIAGWQLVQLPKVNKQ